MKSEDAADYIALLSSALLKAKDQAAKDAIKAKLDVAVASLDQSPTEPPPEDHSDAGE